MKRTYKKFEINGNRMNGYCAENNGVYIYSDTLSGLKYKINYYLETGKVKQ